jgi:hypothetical protein
MKKLVLLIAVGMMLTFGSFAFAGTTDVIQYPSPYFVSPANWQNEYRYYNEDWGWTHNGMSEAISTSVTLNIAAYDIDYSQGERDAIYAWERTASQWVFLGYLQGQNNTWTYTNFDLFGKTNLYDEIADGLSIWMDIDSTNNSRVWAVSLSKSALSINGGEIPNPEPTPEPLTMLLLGLGLTGIAGARRFTK